MRLAREGRPFALTATALALLAWSGAAILGAPWALAGAGALTLGSVLVVYFFRDPERLGPQDPALVLAPADGRVVDIQEVEEPSFMGGRCLRISIFLSLFDVHVQRAPVSGTVAHRSDRPGRHGVAWRPEASAGNELASTGVSSPSGPVLVRQIAGLLARRIVTHPREGDRLERGERIGLIRFGSRVDLFLPPEWPVLCRVGDTVRGGASALARAPGASRRSLTGASATRAGAPHLPGARRGSEPLHPEAEE